tara:strand:+ start:733 stop:924 length:192 start_codon:yes stop_codon:yes gene_type:complete
MEDTIEPDFDADDINNDWIEKVYYKNGIKITRYKPSWYKDPEKHLSTTMKGSIRKPTFGPKDP